MINLLYITRVGGDICIAMLLCDAYSDASKLCLSLLPLSRLVRGCTTSYTRSGKGEKDRSIPSIDLQLTGKLSVPEFSNVSHMASGDSPTSCSRYQPQICMFP